LLYTKSFSPILYVSLSQVFLLGDHNWLLYGTETIYCGGRYCNISRKGYT